MQAYTLLVHVGAHVGQEVEEYRKQDVKNVIWIEADKNTYERLRSNISLSEHHANLKINHIFVNAMISDKDGETLDFYKFNNDGQSSSRYKASDLLRQTWPGLDAIGPPAQLTTYRLDSVLTQLKIPSNQFDNAKLLIDVQGGEYQVLNGLGSFLSMFNVIELEVSRQEIYEGQKTFGFIDNIMTLSGFVREVSSIEDIPWHGNVIYAKDKLREAVSEHCKKYFTALYAFREIKKNENLQSDLSQFIEYCASHKEESHAQLFQDLLALYLHSSKDPGYFVEFGAADGIFLSNSYLLEKSGWQGLLAEPARSWHAALKINRKAIIDTRCVFNESDKILAFLDTENNELSTLTQYSDGDLHSRSRATGDRYDVTTVSLNDLLEQHQAPTIIDYLSVDTEGSEFAILESLNFNKYKFKLITVEHNFTPMREEIYNLLIGKGYKRIFSEISAFDDWYVLNG